jgi:hypothetical protein
VIGKCHYFESMPVFLCACCLFLFLMFTEISGKRSRTTCEGICVVSLEKSKIEFSSAGMPTDVHASKCTNYIAMIVNDHVPITIEE